jgi:glutaminase
MFGMTESVLKKVLDLLEDGDYFILDLKHVFEIDRAASQLLLKLKEVIHNRGKILLFTYTANKYGFAHYFKQQLSDRDDRYLFAFEDTDHALEWCEDRLLAEHGPKQLATYVELEKQDLCQGMNIYVINKLHEIVKPVSYDAGEIIFRCGDPAESMYLILEGEVEVLLPMNTGQSKRLATLSPGMSFGEMALLNYRTRSAEVRVSRNSKFAQIVFDDIPEDIRLILITNIAKQLARKLGRETRELQHID